MADLGQMDPAQAEAFLGAPPALKGMDQDAAEAFLGPEPQPGLAGGAALGRVVQSATDAAKAAFGPSPLGLSPETEDALKRAGIFNDAAKGQHSIVRAFNEAVIQPAAAAIDLAWRAGGAALGAFQGAATQAGVEIGQPQLGRDIAALPEAFPTGIELPHAPPEVAHAPLSPAELMNAQDAGLLAQDESRWRGFEGTPANDTTATPRPETAASGAEAVPAGATPETPLAPPQAAPAPPADIHAAARQIAPGTFSTYDSLALQRDQLRDNIATAQQALRDAAEAQAPHAAEIADLRARLEDTTPRLAKKYEARLAELLPEHEGFLSDEFTMGALTRDTDEIAAMRQQQQALDYQMRDLAPDVSAAYRAAAEQMPHLEEPAPVEEAAPVQATAAVGEAATEPPVTAAPLFVGDPSSDLFVPHAVLAAHGEDALRHALAGATAQDLARLARQHGGEAGRGASPLTNRAKMVEAIVNAAKERNAAEAPTKTSIPAAPAVNIVDDVAAKLVAAGRPEDEAQAAAQVVAAHYDARSAAWGGARGTAADLYAKEGPDIRAAGASTARGKIRLDDGRAIITLMKDANASTFVHETGHAWLEELMRDGADEAAPAAIRSDAKAVRQWLGAEEGKAIPTKAHEKFARAFERYLMEGVAPSRALGRVFAQFKDWLTRIYGTVARLRAPISPDIRDVFDRMLARQPERTVYARESPGHAEATLHEAEARTTPPEHAEPAANQVRDERHVVSAREDAQLHGRIKRERRRASEGPGGESPVHGDAAGPGASPTPPGAGGEPATIGAGGDRLEATGAGAPSVQRRERATPYLKAKEPPRLVSFLRKLGGVRDVGGDVAHLIGSPKELPGLVNNATGVALDEAARKAWEAGYFPEFGERRPSTNELLEALEDDLKVRPRYAAGDEEAAEAYHHALANNAEIDRLADAHGIPTKGLTRDQFFDRLRDQMSQDEQAALETDGVHGVEEAEAEVHDAGIPLGGARSLEDIERDRAQERAAAEAGPGQADRGEPAGAAGHPQSGEGRGGQAGGGDRAAGSRGTEKLDPIDVTAPEKKFTSKEDDEVLKAANIRLDKINGTDDMNAALRDLAAQHADFMDARYGSPAYQRQLEIRATRVLLRASTADMMEAARKAASGNEAAILDWAAKEQRAAMVFSRLSTLSADWAHAGHELNRVMPGWDAAVALARRAEADDARTLFQAKGRDNLGPEDMGRLQRMAAAMAGMETAEQAGKFALDLNKTRWQRVRAGIISYFVNSLISGPITHMAYSVGNGVSALYRAVPLTLGQAAVSTLRGAEHDRVFFGEAGAQLYGMTKGARDGIRPAMQALRTGIPQLPGGLQAEMNLGRLATREQALPGRVGYWLETPSRAVSAIHTFFYTMSYSQEIARLAFREAANQGLRGDPFDVVVAKLTASPTPEMMEAASEAATRGVLMRRPTPGGAQDHLTKLVNSNIVAKIVMPFMQIGMNILDEGLLQTTPLSLLQADARAELLGRRGAVARDLRIGKIATGSLIGAAMVGMAAEGMITGGGPSDPNLRRVMEDSGWKAYSLRLGDTYVPYRKFLGYLGPLVAASADMYEIGHTLTGEGLTKAAASLAFGLSEVVADESWMSGLSEFVEAATDWQNRGAAYMRRLAVSFMPFSVGLSQTARLVDPYQRSARTLLDAARANLPGVSMQDEPRIGIWGQPIRGHTMIGPSAATHDPVDARLLALDLGVAPVPRRILNVPLSDAEYTDFAGAAGRLAKMRLNLLVGQPGFSTMSPGEQTRAIQDVISSSRRSAAQMMKLRHPEILRQALKNKANLRAYGRTPPPE